MYLQPKHNLSVNTYLERPIKLAIGSDEKSCHWLQSAGLREESSKLAKRFLLPWSKYAAVRRIDWAIPTEPQVPGRSPLRPRWMKQSLAQLQAMGECQELPFGCPLSDLLSAWSWNVCKEKEGKVNSEIAKCKGEFSRKNELGAFGSDRRKPETASFRRKRRVSSASAGRRRAALPQAEPEPEWLRSGRV